MAEIFKNFLSVSKNVGEKTVVPASGRSCQILDKTDTMGSVNREEESIVQIHSLYITNNFGRVEGNNRCNQSLFKRVDLYIKDISNTNVKVYIASDIELVPGSSFYIEKNITLNPTQYLVLNVPSGIGGNSVTSTNDINVIASSVLFIEDKE